MVSWKYLEDRTKEGCEKEGVSFESSAETFLRGSDHANMERGERHRRRMYGINKLRTIQKNSMTTGTRKLQLMGVLPGRVWRGKALTSTTSTAQDQEGLVACWVVVQACVLWA